MSDSDEWLARITAYVRKDDDLVDWTYLSGAPFVRQANAVDLDVAGVEALLTKRWPMADLTVGYAYLDKQADHGTAAVDASYFALNYARHRLTAAVRYALNDHTTFYFDNELRRQASNPLRGSSTDAYVASLALEWRPPGVEGLGLSLIVDNLSNSNFQEFPGTPAARRQASLKLRYVW
jgi:outer membrane cobalamin receptor